MLCLMNKTQHCGFHFNWAESLVAIPSTTPFPIIPFKLSSRDGHLMTSGTHIDWNQRNSHDHHLHSLCPSVYVCIAYSMITARSIEDIVSGDDVNCQHGLVWNYGTIKLFNDKHQAKRSQIPCNWWTDKPLNIFTLDPEVDHFDWLPLAWEGVRTSAFFWV